MATIAQDWCGGLETELDANMFTSRPEDPEMRESASIWLYEENGEFAFPRIGIEAIGKAWDKHSYQLNFAQANGRSVIGGSLGDDSHSPFDENGNPTILGTGPLAFRCLEPFRRWRVTYDGSGADTNTQAQIDNAVDYTRQTPIKLDVELTMATPGWTQDLRPEKLVGMTEQEKTDAGLMGFGWRVEHTFTAEGTLTLDGKERAFRGVGNRIRRQSVRPLGAFRGHCWQAALFPDGRAFAICTYPPREDGTTYNDGYVYEGGRMYKAIGRNVPWIKELIAEGEDVSIDVEYERGVLKVGGLSKFQTFKVGMAEMPGFRLNQGGAKYTLDGQTTYGMLERSDLDEKLA